ncbi:membrane protein [Halanaerobium saccharolyticum subsp. saccharolyticum DSM 6643]|uniref:Membrane protein n=1 Tax=Halanaerobium saccharolyticum subsp. saccharolyticum DSM 6643 TaxID=1293054 RepID=M5DZC2_9FIRM|nr:hypothetical protein [Halanaerobium saccharolyticum]CCU78543.1 membrane protein [Halanaerobium saccharolyticum subsp. saccharolyticum DSM 6643]
MLQFLFLFIIFLIFLIVLLITFPYHYALSFKFKENLIYSFSVSVIFLKVIFKGDTNKKYIDLEIFNLKKEFNLDDNNKIAGFIENKSKKIIKEKIINKTTVDKKEKREKAGFKFYFKLINKEFLNHIFKFIVEIIKNLKMDYLKLNFVFSFADPYFNGLFLAYYYTFKELFDYPDIKARINWQEVIFEAEAYAGGKIIPIKIIWQVFKFILSLKSLKFFWSLYQLKYKKG